MGRVTWWLIGIILLMPIVDGCQYYSYTTSHGDAWFDCKDYWANITDDEGNVVGNGSNFIASITDGNHNVTIAEEDDCQYVVPINDDLPALRPAPTDSFESLTYELCSQSDYLASSCPQYLLSGNVSDGDDDIFAIDVTTNQIILLDLNAASSALNIEVHFQNGITEEKLENELSTALNTSIGETYQLLIPVSENGRLVFTVSSPHQDTLWMISLEVFETGKQDNLTDLDEISGIGNVTYHFELADDESLQVISSKNKSTGENLKIEYRYVFTETVFSQWDNASIDDRIIGLDNIVAVELRWDCVCEWESRLSHNLHYDADWGIDAPGFKPLSSTSNNSSYPLIPMNGTVFTGELTLFMDDYHDVLRIETTGWEESIHLVDVVVEGNIYELQVSIQNMDQKTWDVVDEISATYSMDKIRVSLDVGLGTHFIKIQHINGSSALNENAESLDWNIRVSTAVLDEGDEPWFPASSAVKEAADIFYWLIGLILIIPFIIFYLNVNSNKRFAKEFARKKDRLIWLSEKLDEGDFSPSDLSRALKSVSSLDWEEALQVWGEPETRHYTNGIDMAVWTLDERLSNTGCWPVLIGVRPQESEWSVAALKFEANMGSDWVVSSVEPKLLKRANEIFLDTIYANSRVFIRVDLEGSSDSLDIYLSGMVNGKPIAAKPANTVYRNFSDSEE